MLGKEFDDVWNVPWKRHPLYPSNVVALAKMYRGLRRRRYDIVHLHTPVAAFLGRAAIAALGHSRPSAVYTAHGFPFMPGSRGIFARLMRLLERTGARWTDVLIVLTEEDEEQAATIGVPRKRIVRIPGIGVDTDHFDISAVAPGDLETLRHSLGLAQSTRLFVCVGEFNARKRQLDLIRALALLNAGVHVAFAGNGPAEQSVRAAAEELGVSPRAHFLGHVKDIRPLMVLATAVVLPSEREGLPRSLLEAMSLETPIIATDTRGSRELAEAGGLVVPVGDIAALAKAMTTLGGDLELSQRLGASGRVAALATYAFDVVASQHDEVYAQVLEARARRTAPA